MSSIAHRLVRALKLGAAAGAVIGVVRAIRGSRPPEPTGQASWQPLVDETPAEKRTGPVRFTDAPASDSTGSDSTGSDSTGSEPRSWADPVGGVCPATHPIKGNAQSGIYHVPGGMSYDRTVPERCYASEADAEADGFRKAKR